MVLRVGGLGMDGSALLALNRALNQAYYICSIY
jgi:hypothetical protein